MNLLFNFFIQYALYEIITSIDLRYAIELDFLEKYVNTYFKYNINLENKKNEMEKAYLLNLAESDKKVVTIHVSGKIKEDIQQQLDIYLTYDNVTKKKIPSLYDSRKFDNFISYDLNIEPLQFDYYIVMKNCKTIIVNGYDDVYQKPKDTNVIILDSQNLPYFPFNYIFNRDINQIVKIDITKYKFNEENLFKFYYFEKDNLKINYNITIINELDYGQNEIEYVQNPIIMYKNKSDYYDDFFVGKSLQVNNTYLFMKSHLNLRPKKLKTYINIEFNATTNEKFNTFGMFGFVLNEMVSNYSMERNRYLNNQKIILKMFKHHNVYNISYFKINDEGKRVGDYYISILGKYGKINSFYFGNYLINSTTINPKKNNYVKINETTFMIKGDDFKEYKKNHIRGALCLIGIKDMQSDVEVYIRVINNENKSNIVNAGINFLIISFIIIFLFIIKYFIKIGNKRVNKFNEYNNNYNNNDLEEELKNFDE